MKKENPIRLYDPEVLAILGGRKTQLRRIVSPTPVGNADVQFRHAAAVTLEGGKQLLCPFGQPGELMWGREAWRIGAWDAARTAFAIDYRDGPHKRWMEVPDTEHGDGEMFDRLWRQSADEAHKAGFRPDGEGQYRWKPGQSPCRWRPSTQMPRWASRIALQITSVRVERLRDISEADAKAEGALFHDGLGVGHSGWRHDFKEVHDTARSSFARHWCERHTSQSWHKNPWVWVAEFERVDAQKGE